MLTAAVADVGLAVLTCYLADVERTLVPLTPAVPATRAASLVYRLEVRADTLSPLSAPTRRRSSATFGRPAARRHRRAGAPPACRGRPAQDRRRSRSGAPGAGSGTFARDTHTQ